MVLYCSLEEAWGESFKPPENDTTVSYCGGNQTGSELHPMFNNNNETISQDTPEHVNNYELPSNASFNNIMPVESVQSNNNVGSTALVRTEDVNKEQLWNEFMKFLENKKNNNNSVQENFSNIKSMNNDNSYVDLLILILFGIVIIFIMDSFVRLGKNMKD
jgi:hypothetical protein